MIRQRSPHWLSFSAVVFLHVERAGFLYRVMRVLEDSHLISQGAKSGVAASDNAPGCTKMEERASSL